MSVRIEPLPLSRNRNYNLLWITQVVSELGSDISYIAFPLLILATSGSPLEMGIVSAASAAAHMVGELPGGVLADRFDRKKIMLLCDGCRALALGSLAVALLAGVFSFEHVLVVAVVEGLCASMFGPAEEATVPRIVHETQLSTAVARNTARTYIAGLVGPGLGGFLFSVNRMVPFLVDAVSYAVSFVGLLFLRLPPREADAAADDDEEPAAEGLSSGFAWVLRHRVIRTTLVWIVGSNLVFAALVIVILALAGEHEAGPGEIGIMMSFFGVGGLLGAVVAPRLHAALPAPVIVLGFSWIAAALTTAMAFAPGGLALGAILGVVAFFAPVANTTIITYQMTVTPDEYRGRLSGVTGLCGGVAGALGPLVGGLLMTGTGGGATGVLACATALAVIAIAATLNPTLRRFPTLRQHA
ncbi:MFS transporter [Actinophytocola sp. KF-1]